MLDQISPTQTGKLSMISLGCAKNEVDSEEMLGILQAKGFTVNSVHSPSDVARSTDVVVINTCAFIESAREESVNTIIEAVERKKRGEIGRVIVTGCLAQRYPDELANELPEVDAFLGTGQIGSIGDVVDRSIIRTSQIQEINVKPHHQWVTNPNRVRLGYPWSAYLKISEGCDHACTFCSIPSFRGKHISKPIETIVEEAELLASQGVKEINLIAQDSTQYGYDLYGKMRLPELLQALSKVDKLHWIRLFYCYPSRVDRGIIEAIADTPKVCHYIDMPLQHADDAMLRRMRRPMTGKAYLDLIHKFREIVPDVAIRTTFIVGFPGETKEEFANLESFVDEAQFDRLGVFTYSVEEGTPSAEMKPRITSRVKNARRDSLLEQQAISKARNQMWIGREMEVLIESRHPNSPTTAVGRSFRDGPEVDGQVYIQDCMALPGTFVNALIIDASSYDLVAVSLDADRLPQTNHSIFKTF